MQKEQTQVPLDEQILLLEKELQTSTDPKVYKELVFLRVQKYQQEGMTELDAKKKAYTEAEEQIKKDERLFGSSPITYFLKWQFNGALLAMEHNRPDPLDTEIHGVKLATLDIQTAKNLEFDSPEKYRDLAQALKKLGNLYGEYSELTEMRIWLEIKADYFSR